MTVTTDRRRRVYERDGGKCVVGGWACSGGLTVQHRANRGMGGSLMRDGYENLLTMCNHHNVLLEQSAAFAQTGRDCGWKLEQWEDPFLVAVWSSEWVGGWRLLDGAGEAHPCMARDAEKRAALAADRYAGWREQ